VLDFKSGWCIWFSTFRKLTCAALLEELLHHSADFFNQEGYTPLEEIHATRKMERLLHVLVLLDVHFVILNQNYGSLVVVLTAVVWRAKNSNDRWECSISTPSMHLVAINLYLMCSDDTNEVIVAQDVFDRIETKLDGAFTLRVRAEAQLASFTIVHGIRPKQITKETFERRFFEAVYPVDISCAFKLRRDATMHAKVVTVDVGSNRHGFEAFNKEIVDMFVVELLQDLLTERKVLRHGSRLVIATQHHHIFWEVDLEAEEEDTNFERKDSTINIVSEE